MAFAVTPMTVTLLPQTTYAFSTAGAPGAVTWSLSGGSAGSVTPAGVYTAGTTAGPYTLTATSGTAKATASITVVATPLGSAVPALVGTGELADATGNGTQSHLAYTDGTGTATAGWWLFHDPSAAPGMGGVAAEYSKDFVTWTSAGQLMINAGNSGQGVDLAVANGLIGGKDVVHVSQGYGTQSPGPLGRYHLRPVLNGTQVLTWGDQVSVESFPDGGATPGDGASVGILPSGFVVDASGYAATYTLCPTGYQAPNCGGEDSVAFTSNTADTGTVPDGGLQFSPTVLWCTGRVAARQVLVLGSTAIVLYVDGGNMTPPNVLMNTYNQTLGAWSPLAPTGTCGSGYMPPLVFSTGAAAANGLGLDDWTAAVFNGTVHAVRRFSDGSFEHRIMDPTAFTWGAGAALPTPAQGSLQNSGLFLGAYGDDDLILLSIGGGGNNAILYTAYSHALGTWSSWLPLTFDAASAGYLSGHAPGSSVKPAILWTKPVGSSYGIFGLQLP